MVETALRNRVGGVDPDDRHGLDREAINTAIERMADVAHPDEHPEVGKLKDLAAAAVLLASIGRSVWACACSFGEASAEGLAAFRGPVQGAGFAGYMA